MCLYATDSVKAITPMIYKTYLVGYKKFNVCNKILSPFYQNGKYVIEEEIGDGLPVYPYNQDQQVTVSTIYETLSTHSKLGHHISMKHDLLNNFNCAIPVLIPTDKIQMFGLSTCVAETFIFPTPRIVRLITCRDKITLSNINYEDIYHAMLKRSVIISLQRSSGLYKPIFKYAPNIDMPEFDSMEEAIAYLHSRKDLI